MPLQATSGTASYDAFGGGAAVEPVYIEQIFQTYLYTGNGSSQTITNGIDLSTKGGLVWLKYRTDGGANHIWTDTVRGATKSLYSNATDAQATVTQHVTGFTTSGFSVGNNGNVNDSGGTFASWTFRKQPKFFDVVTYTGNGTAGRTVAHSLGSVPGCIIIKRTDSTSDWPVYHAGFFPYADQSAFLLNSSASTTTGYWNNTLPTSTVFSVSSDSAVNANGGTYVAYLFANQAGGFGLTGSDSVVACGSAATGSTVTLGWEPQWILTKTKSAANWKIYDTMRGMPVISGGSSRALYPNTSDAEGNADNVYPTSTGFTYENSAGVDFLYVAIRRGPMKVPTSGTSVFSPVTYSGTGATRVLDASIVPDIYMGNTRTPAGGPIGLFVDRLRGDNTYIQTTSTGAESTVSPTRYFSGQTGLGLDTTADNVSGRTYVSWFMRRAPNFFDEVCYTGTDVDTTAFNHSLGVKPEMIWIKSRSGGTSLTGAWFVWSKINSTTYATRVNANTPFGLNLTATANASTSSTVVNGATSTTFTPAAIAGGSSTNVNSPAATYVAYLFATCAGVSKVGSYTGTGTTLQVDCGFTGGARFVLIKRTDTDGDWYVWDSARGIVSGNDPHLSLNTTAAEVTSDDTIDTDSTGFVVNQVAATNVNVSSATYIFLSIA